MPYVTGELVWADLITPDTKFTARYRARIKPDEASKVRLEAANIRMDDEHGIFSAETLAFTKEGERRNPPYMQEKTGQNTTQAPRRGDLIEIDFTISNNTDANGKFFAMLNGVRILERQAGQEDAYAAA